MTLTLLEWILLALAAVGWGLFFIARNHARHWEGLCLERDEQLKKSQQRVELLRQQNIDRLGELLREKNRE